jgi:hypothetical protein
VIPCVCVTCSGGRVRFIFQHKKEKQVCSKCVPRRDGGVVTINDWFPGAVIVWDGILLKPARNNWCKDSFRIQRH